jgi:omega-6 fatty acid desaturase (delta-12 desaturase)
MTAVTPALAEPTGRPAWKVALAPYARPHLGRSIVDLLTSVLPYAGLSVGMYFLLDVSYWLVLAAAVPASGFLLRTYILFHDCTHGSFLPSKRANTWLGRTLGVIVFSPFSSWKHNHAVHHATAGDLDRRGTGDIPTLTVAEYYGGGRKARFGYRLFRNPLVMFGVGPLYALILYPRFIPRNARSRVRNSVLANNIALVAVIALICWAIGWQNYLLIQVPTAWLAATAGVWLFYVQHQFEDTYWRDSDEWSYADAALRGSSYLKLPKVLQFFSGNIGLHHVHHLSARVPNYHLQRAHDANPIFHDVPVLSLWDGLRATRLKLWDEETERLLTWKQAKATRKAARNGA